MLTLNMFFLTEWKLICREHKLWKQPPKRFVRFIKTLPKIKNYMWSSVCSNIANFNPATLLTMKSFIGLKIPHRVSSIGRTLYFAECFSMAASEIRRKSWGLSASTAILVFYTCFYISVLFLKMCAYIFAEDFLEDEN